eukprot:m.261564 g.261564  ORF g.261564 m.261564 type:complete len:387 (+) comp42424_c0_seq1:147-1307(+)
MAMMVFKIFMSFLMIQIGFINEVTALRPSVGCGNESPLRPGEEARFSFTVDGIERFYQLKLPTTYTISTPIPFLVSFHGWRSSGIVQQISDQFGIVGEEENFVVAWPDGHGDHRSGTGVWNSWHGVGSAESPGPEGATCTNDEDFCYASCEARPQGCHRCDWTTCVDDVAFVEALLDTMERALCLDLDMLYATGFSNGGMFSWQAGMSLAHRLAAVAPGGGQPFVGFVDPPDLSGGSRISNLDFHGLDDIVCPPFGGQSGGPEGQRGWIYAAVSHGLRVWAEAHECSSGFETKYPTPWDEHIECYRQGECTDNIEFVRCVWLGAHTWPKLPTNIEGSRFVWWFLKNHPFVSSKTGTNHVGGGNITSKPSAQRYKTLTPPKKLTPLK